MMYPSSGSSAYHHGQMRVQYLNYVRNSRAVAVIWGIFTICFAILNIVAFIQPQWIGDTDESPQVGYFGLFNHCIRNGPGSTYECSGEFTDFSTILSGSFQAAAFFVGFSALLFLICIACFLLFFLLNTATVLQICGWMQAISAVCMFLGCVIYPNGWDNDTIKSVCGFTTTDSYNSGTCGLRWAFILSIILIFDAIILALLAFLLAYKQMKLLPEVYGKGDGSKSEYNGYSDTYASKSHTMDRFSEYSTHRSERSKHSQAHSHRY